MYGFTILIVRLCNFVKKKFMCSDGNIFGRHQLRVCGQKRRKNSDFVFDFDDSSLLTMNSLEWYNIIFFLRILPSPVSCYYLTKLSINHPGRVSQVFL